MINNPTRSALPPAHTLASGTWWLVRLPVFFVMLSTGMSHPVFQLPGLVNIQKAIEHGHFIVDLPIKSMVIFNSKLLVYQRV